MIGGAVAGLNDDYCTSRKVGEQREGVTVWKPVTDGGVTGDGAMSTGNMSLKESHDDRRELGKP